MQLRARRIHPLLVLASGLLIALLLVTIVAPDASALTRESDSADDLYVASSTVGRSPIVPRPLAPTPTVTAPIVPRPNAHAPDYDLVVTVGDSYAAGVGIHANETGYDDHGPRDHSFWGHLRMGASTCKRDNHTNHGAQLANHLGADHQNIACGGAETEHIGNQLNTASIPGTGAGTLIVLTAGGNDLRSTDGSDWPAVLRRCILEFWLNCDKRGKNQIANFDTIQNRAKVIYESMIADYPDATVRIMGYPEIMQRTPRCSKVTGVDKNEADWMDRQVRTLNDGLNQAVDEVRAATGADVTFVSVADAFDDHGSCGNDSQAWINDRVPGVTFHRTYDYGTRQVTSHFGTSISTAASFHPNQRGYNAFYWAVRDTL